MPLPKIYAKEQYFNIDQCSEIGEHIVVVSKRVSREPVIVSHGVGALPYNSALECIKNVEGDWQIKPITVNEPDDTAPAPAPAIIAPRVVKTPHDPGLTIPFRGKRS
jgi:hypothetical protein